MQLAKRLKAVKPSPTLSLNAKARALAAKGADVLSFAAGEPDFDTPAHIKDAIKAGLDSGFTKYTATGGIPELKAAIVEKLAKENQFTVTPEQVVVTVGGKQALYNAFQAMLSPGDEVIIFSPYWVSYPDMVRLADGEPVIVETNAADNWTPDPKALRKALTSRTKAVIFNSPSNPSGAVIGREALTALANELRGHDCVLITDDIYERLLYVDGPFFNIANVGPEFAARTLVVNGFSKAFSMTGLRLGYAAGPKDLIAGMQMIQDQSTSNATSVIQKGAVAALKGPTAPIDEMVKAFAARRIKMTDGLNKIPGVKCRLPDGAFYCFADISELIGKSYKGASITGSMKLSEILLDDFLLAAVPGEPFGAEGFIRLSFATSDANIEKGLARLADFVSKLS
ncbi:MAG: aspartate aminotransferase [Archangium gephyra]|uniref:Aminotransferase n=1 Tax=Archangium gephyra TaxID=48 RepID=A0A2W5VHV2_9BACT|nr:MAG: aspartate aminotransferase [Archangium gephyra]